MITILERNYPQQVIGDILANHLRVVEADDELYKNAQMCVLNALSAAETYTNRILIDSAITISFDRLESRVIELPTAPIREIMEIRYYGMDGEWHTIEGYNLVSNAQRAMLELREMPAIDTTRMLDIFEIDARVGFEDIPVSTPPSTTYPMPGDIIAALMLMSATLLENPADNMTGTIASELPLNARMLLSPYRITPYGL